MVSFTVRMTFHPEDRKDIEDVLLQLAPASCAEPGCVTYVPLWVEGDPATLVIWEQYRDDVAVDAHRASPHFAEFAVGGLYQKMLERHVENLQMIA